MTETSMNEHAHATSRSLYEVPSSKVIADIVREVWVSFLDADPAQLVESDAELPAQRVSACVHLSGAWSGSVMAQCSVAAAQAAAAALFAMDPSELGQAEIVDAIGEITNMVGGNVKSQLPGPTSLSLPAVAEGQGSVLFVPGAQLVQEARLSWRGEMLAIGVWQVQE